MIPAKIYTNKMGEGTKSIIKNNVGLDMVEVVGISTSNNWYIVNMPEGKKSSAHNTFQMEGPWTMFDNRPDIRSTEELEKYQYIYFPVPSRFVQLLETNKEAKGTLERIDAE